MSNVAAEKTVRLTIDGKTAEVPFGKTILDAARSVGIDVPTLCQHDWVSPIGSCRLCVVKIKGLDGVVTSCTTPATDGMDVTTDDDELHQMRCEQMEFILLNHPLDCPVCDKAGECRLQDLTYSLDVNRQPFEATMPVEQLVDAKSPLIERNDARCVRCGRCVAVCHEAMAVGAYRFAGRGYSAKIDTQDGGPLACEFCGQCVAICPVGALTNKLFKYKARVWDLKTVETVCGYCGAGCQLELGVRRNHVYRVTSELRSTSNNGLLCIRGRFGFGYIHSEERQGHPMIRREGEMSRVDWDEALDAVAEGIRHALATGGPEAVGVLVNPRLPVEDAYLAGYVFGGVVGTPQVAVSGQDGYGEAMKTTHNRLGKAGSTATFADIGQSDALLLLGSDLAVEMPVPHLSAIQAVNEHDAKLICACSYPTKLENFATTRLRYRPGEETAVLLLLLRKLVELKMQNVDFIMKRTEGFAAFKAGLDRLDAEQLLARTGLDVDAVQKAAKELAKSKKPVIVLGNQALGSPMAGRNAGLAIDLLLALGRIEKSLLFSSDRCNVFGAMLAGLIPGRGPGLSAYAETPVGWPRMPEEPGKGYAGVLEAGMAGHLSALVLLGANPLVGTPMAEPLRKAIEVTGFVVATDPFLNTTAKLANVYLPTQTFAERGGTYVSAEGRMLELQRAVEPHEGALPEWRILSELARRLGKPRPSDSMTELWQEIQTNVPDFAEIDRDAMGRQGTILQRFGLGENEKIAFGALPKPAEPLAGDILLLTGPVLYHNGTLSQWAEGPMEVCPEPWIALHPADAQRLGVDEGQKVKIRRNGVELIAPVRLDEKMSLGTAFAPHHFDAFPVGRLLDESPWIAVEISR